MSPEEIRASQVALLLQEAGMPPASAIIPMAGGRNNKVFRVETPEGSVLFKSYFHHPDDPRDRLSQEFAFLRHLEATGSRHSARPLAKIAGQHVGLMEFLGGVRPNIEEVDRGHVEEAVAFFLSANSANEKAGALPNASEACFSIAEHLAGTQRRTNRLDQMLIEDDVDREAAAFVADELLPLWKDLHASVAAEAKASGILEPSLDKVQRCLSPSDFGFHNSLRQEDGRLKFLDFEYAGWDDPAKLVIDFANQPDMLLDEPLCAIFQKAVLANDPRADELSFRIRLLEPVYQVKWACICLNDFLAFGRMRHQFTEGEKSDHRARRAFQLERSRTMQARAARRGSRSATR